MTNIKIVDERTILQEVLRLVASARQRVDLGAPWVRGPAIRRVLAAVPAGVGVRVLFRVKEPEDLEITDLQALLEAARRGVEVRYSGRLHAKVIVVDGEAAIVSSSNLTEAAGFGRGEDAASRNRELGVVVGDPEAAAAIQARFEEAWAEGQWLDDAVVGVAMDFPTEDAFHVACWRTPAPGSYLCVPDFEGRTVVGRVAGLTAYNRTFPRMTAGMWATQGYGVAPDAGGRSYEYTDLQTLFSTPDKERGVLGVVAACDPRSLFHVARVEALATLGPGGAQPPRAPVAPGALVRRAGAAELGPLLGWGDLRVGAVWHHPEVEVRAASEELLTRHLAILGMTGSGKSNSACVLVAELLRLRPRLQVVVLDTHGEYRGLCWELGGRVVSPSLRTDLLSEGAIKRLLGLAREDSTLMAKVLGAAEACGGRGPEGLTGRPPGPEGSVEGQACAPWPEGGEGQRNLDLHTTAEGQTCAPWPEGFAAALEREAEGQGAAWAVRARQLAALCRKRPEDFCLGGPAVGFEPGFGPGLNVLDLGAVEGLEARSQVAGAALDAVYWAVVGGGGPALVVLDEAQNYVPEQQTGLLARARPSFEAAFRIASEGRKFGVGLWVVSQRPARVNKDVLSQCNSHLLHRLANVEDLQAVSGCFETAGRRLVDDLPGLPVGVCVAGGTAFGMPVQVRVPRWGSVQELS